jgi:hypothetical protein
MFGEKNPFFSQQAQTITPVSITPKQYQIKITLDKEIIVEELECISNLDSDKYYLTIENDDTEYAILSIEVFETDDETKATLVIDVWKEEDFTKNKTIKDSKIYTLARSTSLLEQLVPDFDGQMRTEAYLENELPRLPEEGDNTRIFIVFTSHKKNTSMIKIVDRNRLTSEFNIDYHLANYQNAIFPPETLPTQDPVLIINGVLQAAVEYLSTVMIGLEEQVGDNLTIAKILLPAITSVVYDDPLDVFIMLNENRDTGESVVHLTKMWAVKSRNKVD